MQFLSKPLQEHGRQYRINKEVERENRQAFFAETGAEIDRLKKEEEGALKKDLSRFIIENKVRGDLRKEVDEFLESPA